MSNHIGISRMAVVGDTGTVEGWGLTIPRGALLNIRKDDGSGVAIHFDHHREAERIFGDLRDRYVKVRESEGFLVLEETAKPKDDPQWDKTAAGCAAKFDNLNWFSGRGPLEYSGKI